FDKRTPLLFAPMRTVQFRPYWNVPRSILRDEILPVLERQPRYLAAERMEVVGPRDTVLGDTLTPEILRGLAAGTLRVRQRPGPWNALGRTKFSFPNLEDVYLHGTPDTAAFRLSRRDLSHGCIRVRDPVALATWALQGEGGWDLARVDSALVGRDTATVAIPDGLSLLIFYTTAVATPDGQVHFYRDYYGQDRALLAALRARRPPAPSS
ncbi:MAG TPA: L,D-transpeptidase family protein, partial [Gemmatimonadales bacterium]|nr:L,D-transpeptidase family protein [Gemmatimonadales bacterium]